MKKYLLASAAGLLFSLTGCNNDFTGYSTMVACHKNHDTCHEGIAGGYWPGAGIDPNSPAGLAILSGFMQGGGFGGGYPQPPQTIYFSECTIYNRVARQC